MNKLQEEMQAEVLAFQNSGKSQVAYAKERGISWSKLNYWVKKFVQNEDVTKLEEPKFVELSLQSKSAPELIQKQNLEIELTLPGGVSLRMREV